MKKRHFANFESIYTYIYIYNLYNKLLLYLKKNVVSININI